MEIGIIILIIYALYATWHWWIYFCMTLYLADHMEAHGVSIPDEEQILEYINRRASSLLIKFLKS